MVVFVVIKTNKRNGRMKDMVIQTSIDPRYEQDFFRGQPYRKTSGKWGKADFFHKDQIVKVITPEEFERRKKTRKDRQKEYEEKQTNLYDLIKKE